MTLRLYDSRARSLLDFVPRSPDQVGVYVCGPTVQSAPHIGHLRSALVYDILRRWLSYRGYRVVFVRNVTDIDDKILVNASESEPWWALAYRVEREFTTAYNTIGILPPTYEPRATGSIPEMQAIIERLIARGHAYSAADGTGDVYFDTGSWSDYGELTHQSRDDMTAAEDSDPRGKRDVRDFALWKGHKQGDPDTAAWTSPWGLGRPGWHIECSAMSTKYLGSAFDIHGGGLDLRFPHHENELAQSRAAGDEFTQYWLHNGLVSVASQKMSKSLGNSVFASDLLSAARPAVVRYYLGAAHYRSTLEFYDGALEEADAAYSRIETFIERATRRVSGTRFVSSIVETIPAPFADAMDDDLAVPQALGELHERVRQGNAALDDQNLADVAEALGEVLAMTSVLGLNPNDPVWRADADGPNTALTALVDRLISDRQVARDEKDWTTADRIRHQLADSGVSIEDTETGTRWSLDA